MGRRQRGKMTEGQRFERVWRGVAEGMGGAGEGEEWGGGTVGWCDAFRHSWIRTSSQDVKLAKTKAP